MRGSPADKIEHWPTDRIRPYPNNPRVHSELQLGQLVRSLERFDWTSPILIDEEGMIIAGHGRWLAACKLGRSELPVVVARGWSDAKKRACRISDNKITDNSYFDRPLLGVEIRELLALGDDLKDLAFEDSELAAYLVPATTGLTDPDDVPAPLPEPISAQGEVWLLGHHRLACGDCTSEVVVHQVLAGATPLLMVTDPPYGVRYDPAWRNRAGISRSKRTGKVENDDRADWREAWALFPGDVGYIWHGALHATTVAESLTACGFQIRAQIVWAKDRLVFGRGDFHWQHEPAWYAVRGSSHWKGGRQQTTLWQIASRGQDTDTIHGTQKPVACMQRPIENNSSPGQAVYEPFSGSGTTIIAAEMTGRSCLAIELNPAYVDVAIRRWQAFTGEVARLEQTGRSFEEVAAERGVTLIGQSDGAARAQA